MIRLTTGLTCLFLAPIVLADGGGPYTYDSGTSTDALGLGTSGQMLWLHAYDAQGGNDVVQDVTVAFGSPVNAPNVQDGLQVTVVVFDDPNNDRNPADAQLLQAVNTTVQNADTDTFVTVPVPNTAVNGTFFVGAFMKVSANRRPAGRDTTVQVPQGAWVVGNTSGNLDLGNLGNNDIFGEMQNAVWMLRANCTSKPALLYGGLRHTQDGQGQLTVTQDGMFLHGIGSSGQDGFTTDAADFARMAISHVVGDPIVLPSTARVSHVWEMETGVTLGMDLVPAAPNYQMRFPINVNVAPKAVLYAMFRGKVVDSFTYSTLLPDQLLAEADLDSEEVRFQIHELAGGPDCPPGITLSWSQDHALSIAGRPVVTADGIRLLVKDLGALGVKKKLRVRATDTPATLFKLVKVSLLDLIACAHEKTELEGDKGKIEVEPEEPGQPEEKGVTLTPFTDFDTISFDAVIPIRLVILSSTDADINLEFLHPPGGPPAMLTWQTTGRVSGEDGVNLGTMHVVDDGAAQLRLMLSDLLGTGNGTPRTVKVLNNGALVGEVSGQTGPLVASFDTQPKSFGVRTEVFDELVGSPGLAGLHLGWEAPLCIELAPNCFVGDELVIVTDEAELSTDGIDFEEFKATFNTTGLAIVAHTHSQTTERGERYCGPAVVNSSDRSARVYALGSNVASDNDFRLVATGMPAGQFGYFIASETQGFIQGPGGSVGNLCLSGKIARFRAQIRNSGTPGSFTIPVDLTNIPTSPPSTVMPGDTWYFSTWFRDVGGTSNFTDGVCVEFE